MIELESKLLETNLNAKYQLEKESNGISKIELNGKADQKKIQNSGTDDEFNIKERLSSTDLIFPIGDAQTLFQESLQFRGLLVGEIEALEKITSGTSSSSLSSSTNTQDDQKNPKELATDYAQKYGFLRQEHEGQVQRLIMKLSQEQLARTELEDRLEQTLQRLWSQQSSEGDKASNGFFSKLFNPSNSEIKSSRANYIKRERDLCRELEKQTGRVAQLSAALDSNKEAQRIVLETKESILRSLLTQNAQISQERDTLAQKVEELDTAVEQLTALLRSVQSRTISRVGSEEIGNGAAAVVVKSSVILGGGHSPTRTIDNTKTNVILGGGGKMKYEGSSI
eukprot:CAMPEP_0174825840 /NCGR_PEP_ID=MMETSP1107-20130205/43167_1 /TAXON_ID=36770 /ORGANISM="Paraphysomonas vestita, Strain GFlagA" /LENGTH=338 /DNA_ID=CAMNT_0016057863 /DNA_START=1347 /DNA_END=2363 /DNA_ORIENTATION=-